LMQFEEESILITLMQLSTTNALKQPFPDALKALPRHRRKLIASSTNVLLSSKKKFLFIESITLLIGLCRRLVILSRILQRRLGEDALKRIKWDNL